MSTEKPLAGTQYRIGHAYGKLVGSGSFGQGALDVAALPAGIYTIRIITTDQQNITRRFVQ
ncbi:hypothetical protein ACVWYF_002199 [Hymenobacter sp. UYAg731]